jgi:glutathionylspermidine synthase
MAPGHPNLVPAFFNDDPRAWVLGSRFVRMPIFSREHPNMSVVRPEAEDGAIAVANVQANCPHVVQQYTPLPSFGGECPVLGCWQVAGRAAGLGIRAAPCLAPLNAWHFVPHAIID